MKRTQAEKVARIVRAKFHGVRAEVVHPAGRTIPGWGYFVRITSPARPKDLTILFDATRKEREQGCRSYVVPKEEKKGPGRRRRRAAPDTEQKPEENV